MLRIILLILFLLPFWSVAQYKGVSYELQNEVGTYKLTSLTISHRIDNEEGITYVTNKTGTDTLYFINQFLNGFVALSNDGRTVAHLQSELNSTPLNNISLTFYRDGKKFDSAKLKRLLKYELDDVVKREALPKSGWLRNDSLLHKMASNSFYVTDDKVFISTDGPLLHVLNMNQMLHIYTGNGANHFMQNYYSIPNLPFRTEFTSPEYFPKRIPTTETGIDFKKIVAESAKLELALPEEAKYQVEIDVLVKKDGASEYRKSAVFSKKTNIIDDGLVERLKSNLPPTRFTTSSIPPNHLEWVFSEVFWLK